MKLPQRLTDSTMLQLTLGMHLGLLVVLAAVHRHCWTQRWYAPPYVIYCFMTGLCAGLFLAQICLIGGWVAFSRASSALRGAALVLLVPLLAVVHAQVFNDTNFFVWWFANREYSWLRYSTWGLELTLLALAVAVCGLGLRLAGFRLSHPDEQNAEPGWQLRLVDLGGWIAVLGLACAVPPWLQEFGWTWGHLRMAFEWSDDPYFICKGEFVLLSLIVAASLLWPRSSRWGIGLLILLPLAFSLFDNWWLGPLRPDFSDSVYYYHRKIFSHDTLAWMYFVFCLVFGGSLLVVRDRGYRLEWSWPGKTASLPN